MNQQTMESLIKTILEKEEDDLQNFRITFRSDIKNHIQYLKYENCDQLLKLHATISSDTSLKTCFVDILDQNISNAHESISIKSQPTLPRMQPKGQTSFVSNTAISFYCLLRLGYSKRAVDAFVLRNKNSGLLYNLFLHLINLESVYFDIDQLTLIIDNIQKIEEDRIKSYFPPYSATQYLELLDKAKSGFIQLRYNYAADILENVNLEINSDKDTLETKISQFNFGEDFSRYLAEIDDFIYDNSSDMVNAGLIATLRSFMEDLQKNIANQIARLEGEAIPRNEERSEMGDIRHYIKSKLDFSDNENKLLSNYINILHAQGGHNFLSRKFYFRLAKNIGIEFSLLIVSLFEDKYGERYASS